MEQAQIEQLEDLAKAGNDFADSLIYGKYGLLKRGYLTEKQEAAAIRMLDRINNPQPTDAVKPLNKVYDFLHAARQHLKFPKLMMAMGDNFLKVYISGQRSRYPDDDD